MSKSVAVIHTGPATLEPLKARFRQMLPQVRMINIVDDSLLNDAIAAGGLTQAVTRRMVQYFLIAQDMGVDAIFNACSSVGETVDAALPLVETPILKIDEPMARQAAEIGGRIAVIATVPTTLEPTVRLIEKMAAQMDSEITIQRALVPDAFDLLLAGKAEEHDQKVMAEIKGAAEKADAIVLAQCSMARLVPLLGDAVQVPVLSSPDTGVAYLKEFLGV
ncbi:MAG: aspartate/glutamate racemase family protein [Limnochordia bacterium]